MGKSLYIAEKPSVAQEFAKALENAARNGNIAFVKAQHDNILKEYDELLEKLREVLE